MGCRPSKPPTSHETCERCKTKTLLYIDDEEDNLELFKGVLAHKWKVYGWGTPPPLETISLPVKAIEKVEAHPLRYPVVICDYSMPQLNGVETCRALKAIDPSSYKCILSAYTSANQRSKEKWLEFYSKPEDMEVLYKKIREIFG